MNLPVLNVAESPWSSDQLNNHQSNKERENRNAAGFIILFRNPRSHDRPIGQGIHLWATHPFSMQDRLGRQSGLSSWSACGVNRQQRAMTDKWAGDGVSGTIKVKMEKNVFLKKQFTWGEHRRNGRKGPGVPHMSCCIENAPFPPNPTTIAPHVSRLQDL